MAAAGDPRRVSDPGLVPRLLAGLSAATARGLDLGAAILATYARILFGTRPAGGLLVLGATLVDPSRGLLGLGALLAGRAVLRLLHLREEPVLARYGVNLILLGLAVGGFFVPGVRTLALLAVAVVAVVFVQGALESLLAAPLYLPVLSLPFQLVTLALLLVAPALPWLAPRELLAWYAPVDGSGGVAFAELFLRTLGAVFFAPDPRAGALVLLGLVVWSRFGALLALVGHTVAWLLASCLAPQPSPLLLALGYNAIFVAISVGGVFFVPSRAALLLGAIGALLAGGATIVLAGLLGGHGLPVLILPFQGTLALLLLAMRQRPRDGAPDVADLTAPSPEASFAEHRERVVRFGATLPVPIGLPFLGRWTVTQGEDGPHTHQGLWRHALDFEVEDEAGRRHSGTGTALRDYHCFRLPVLAAAAGRVVKVQGDVADNPVGERNAVDPWGNLVLIQHGADLYSLVCHLAQHSLEVKEGQEVAAGTRLGLCGNSGRSFVPHLHFQLQGSARLGAPTRPLDLSGLVRELPEGPRLDRRRVPRLGETVRNLEPRDDAAALCRFALRSRRTYLVSDGRRSWKETIVAGLDLYNRLHFEEPVRGDRLILDSLSGEVRSRDFRGDHRGVLYLLHLAAPRLPRELGGLAWDDLIAPRHLRAPWANLLADWIEPLVDPAAQRLDYVARRDGEALLVRGAGRRGSRRLQTRARLLPGAGPVELAVTIGSRTLTASLVQLELEEEDDAPSCAAAAPLHADPVPSIREGRADAA